MLRNWILTIPSALSGTKQQFLDVANPSLNCVFVAHDAPLTVHLWQCSKLNTYSPYWAGNRNYLLKCLWPLQVSNVLMRCTCWNISMAQSQHPNFPSYLSGDSELRLERGRADWPHFMEPCLERGVKDRILLYITCRVMAVCNLVNRINSKRKELSFALNKAFILARKK